MNSSLPRARNLLVRQTTVARFIITIESGENFRCLSGIAHLSEEFLCRRWWILHETRKIGRFAALFIAIFHASFLPLVRVIIFIFFPILFRWFHVFFLTLVFFSFSLCFRNVFSSCPGNVKTTIYRYRFALIAEKLSTPMRRLRRLSKLSWMIMTRCSIVTIPLESRSTEFLACSSIRKFHSGNYRSSRHPRDESLDRYEQSRKTVTKIILHELSCFCHEIFFLFLRHTSGRE